MFSPLPQVGPVKDVLVQSQWNRFHPSRQVPRCIHGFEGQCGACTWHAGLTAPVKVKKNLYMRKHRKTLKN